MQLFVRGYLGVHTVDVTGFESVESLRNHVCQLEGIDEVENQILNFNGAPLIEEEPLLACGLSEVRISNRSLRWHVIVIFAIEEMI